MKTVVVITTGGTIASRYDPETKRHVACVDGESLLAALPRRPPEIRLDLVDFTRIHGFNLGFAHIVELARVLRERLGAPEAAGAVITQGTDTLEETSYLLDLILDLDKPVVLTGAQLPADDPQTDGPRNLTDAIAAAAAPKLIGLGVTLCFNGRIHAAREVTKSHTSALETFVNPGLGALAIVDEGQVILYRRPLVRRHYAVEQLGARVPLITLALDSDTLLIDAALEAGVDGLVIAAFGRGNVKADFVPKIDQAIKRGIPVVITSRCPAGRVKPIYGTGGGGRELEDLGVIFAGDLKGPKARALLVVLLSTGLSPEEIRREFARNAP